MPEQRDLAGGTARPTRGSSTTTATTGPTRAGQQSELTETVAPDMDLSDEEKTEAEAIIDVFEDLPTVSQDDLKERVKDRVLEEYGTLQGPAIRNVLRGEMAKRTLPGLDLPGFGEMYTEDDGQIPCGADMPHICTGCGHAFEVGRTCARSTCPRCAPAWVTKRAWNHVARIQEAAKMKSANIDAPVYKHHAMISPPPGVLVDADDPVDELKSVIKKFMDVIDMDGVGYYHGYRGADADDHEDDRGEWKKRQFSMRDWEGDVREELERSPHFHLVGACPWFPGGDVVKQIFEETGWVIHRITERNGSPVSLGDMTSVARAVTYCLSHTSLDTDGGRNEYVHVKKGSAYHNAAVYDSTERKAKEAVRKVAPQTLGLSTVGIECKAEVPDDECDHDHDDLDDGDADDGDGDSSTDDGMTTCRGDVSHIDDEDTQKLIENEGWQETALHADRAVGALEKWREVGDWRGWRDLDMDLPPPD